MGWPDSVSSPFPLPANGEELHHLQQQQKTHKQPIYIFDLFDFSNLFRFFLLFVKSASPTYRYVICFFFFFSSASGARSGGAAGGWWICGRCWVGCCRWRLFGGWGRKDPLVEAGAVGLRRWGTALLLWPCGAGVDGDRRRRRQRRLPLRLVEELETAPKEMMKRMGLSWCSSWGKNGKGELRWRRWWATERGSGCVEMAPVSGEKSGWLRRDRLAAGEDDLWGGGGWKWGRREEREGRPAFVSREKESSGRPCSLSIFYRRCERLLG